MFVCALVSFIVLYLAFICIIYFVPFNILFFGNVLKVHKLIEQEINLKLYK